MYKLIRFLGIVCVSSGILILSYQIPVTKAEILDDPPPLNSEVALSVKSIIDPTPLPIVPPPVIQRDKSLYILEQEEKARKDKEESDRREALERHKKEQEEKKSQTIAKPKNGSVSRSGVTTSVSSTSNSYCSCVVYARQRSGINVGSIGIARKHPINNYERDGKNGSIVVLNEGPVGHVAVQISETDSTLTIEEANYKHCQKTTRVLNKSYVNIRGYYEK